MKPELIAPGKWPGESLPVMQGLNALGRETLASVINDQFAQIIKDNNPAAIWCVILLRKEYKGKICHGITYSRIARDSAARLACLHEVGNAFVVGAFWFNGIADNFGYQLLPVAVEYFSEQKARDGLLNRI
jgi:hypothetical protein